MKKISSERRMYSGYPVFVMTYYDKDNKRYNYTTSSSMYVLGKMVVLGLGDNNAKKCIIENKEFSVSFLSTDYISDIEIGAESGKEVDKFQLAKIEMEDLGDVKCIKEAELVYHLTFTENIVAEDFQSFSNLICKLNNVYAKDTLVSDGVLNVEKYNPTIFVGTDDGTFYKEIK